MKQTINRIGGGFSYQNNSYIDNIGAELTYSDASGNSKYNQIGLKLFARLTLFEDLNMNLSYKYLNKKLSTEEKFKKIGNQYRKSARLSFFAPTTKAIEGTLSLDEFAPYTNFKKTA